MTVHRTLVPSRAAALGAGAALALVLSACGTTPSDSAATSAAPETTATQETAAPSTTEATDAGQDADATATILDADGNELGTATFTDEDGAVAVQVSVSDLDPGFYGFHLHATGLCEPGEGEDPDFTTAAGHLGNEETDHPDHAGDLPSLLVTQDGTADLAFTSDRFTVEELSDEDGTAVMVHGGPDNFANIPDHYSSENADGMTGPDESTLSAGDSGPRIACGVVEAA